MNFVHVPVSKVLAEIKRSKFCGCIIEKEHVLHVGVLPHEKEDLILHIVRKLSSKRGLYDSVLGGFVLSVRNISILNYAEILSSGTACHIDIKAIFELYQPKIDSRIAVKVKKVLVPEREYEAVFLDACEVVIKFNIPTSLLEDYPILLVIKDFNCDCEEPFFIVDLLEINSSTDNQ